MSREEIPAASDRELGDALLRIARSAVGNRLGVCRVEEPEHPALAERGATFVTLRYRDDLRGCIGTLDAIRPLGVDVRENAIAAAFRDPRFPPLTIPEYASTAFEVSRLSTPERIGFANETDLLAQFQPGVDGVVLEYGSSRATFLPQVWDDFASPSRFLGALKRKAGLAADFWSQEVRVSRYRVAKWKQVELSSGDVGVVP